MHPIWHLAIWTWIAAALAASYAASGMPPVPVMLAFEIINRLTQ